MGDIIEHVTNPKAALKKAHSLLKETGVLWLSTSNYNSSFTRMMKLKDAMWKELNCTPFVRQYDILNNKWGDFYAKRSTK